MVLETKAGLESGIIGAGHRFAASRLDAQRTTAGWVSEQMGGLSYLNYIRQLLPRVESEWDAVKVPPPPPQKMLLILPPFGLKCKMTPRLPVVFPLYIHLPVFISSFVLFYFPICVGESGRKGVGGGGWLFLRTLSSAPCLKKVVLMTRAG